MLSTSFFHWRRGWSISFKKCMKVKRHSNNLRKMKTVISSWVYCLIFVMSPNGGSLLSEHVYNKFWWKRIWQQQCQVPLQQDHMIIICRILQLHHRTQLESKPSIIFINGLSFRDFTVCTDNTYQFSALATFLSFTKNWFHPIASLVL